MMTKMIYFVWYCQLLTYIWITFNVEPAVYYLMKLNLSDIFSSFIVNLTLILCSNNLLHIFLTNKHCTSKIFNHKTNWITMGIWYKTAGSCSCMTQHMPPLVWVLNCQTLYIHLFHKMFKYSVQPRLSVVEYTVLKVNKFSLHVANKNCQSRIFKD